MQTVILIFSFLIGLVLASFLNALMYRIDKEYKYPDIFTKPSHCEKCKKQLKWYDLIPILSYIFTKGKCSKCKTHITIYYPISELLLGLSFAIFSYTNTPWYFYIILMILFCLTYFDYIYKAIPQTLTLLFLISGVLFLTTTSIIEKSFVINATISGLSLLVCLLFLLIVMYGIKGINIKEGFKGIGIGDFLVLLTLSMFLSTGEFWVMFWLTILLALLFFLPNAILKRMNLKSSLPLLPFITLGYIVVVILGDSIFEYLRNILMI